MFIPATIELLKTLHISSLAARYIRRLGHTNFEFFRIGVILVRYIQRNPKKSITATFKACSLRAVELEAAKVERFGHVSLPEQNTQTN